MLAAWADRAAVLWTSLVECRNDVASATMCDWKRFPTQAAFRNKLLPSYAVAPRKLKFPVSTVSTETLSFLRWCSGCVMFNVALRLSSVTFKFTVSSNHRRRFTFIFVRRARHYKSRFYTEVHTEYSSLTVPCRRRLWRHYHAPILSCRKYLIMFSAIHK